METKTMKRFGKEVTEKFYLFGESGELVAEFPTLREAKAKAEERGGHLERWKTSRFCLKSGAPFVSEWYGGSGNRYTVRDYLPERFRHCKGKENS